MGKECRRMSPELHNLQSGMGLKCLFLQEDHGVLLTEISREGVVLLAVMGSSDHHVIDE